MAEYTIPSSFGYLYRDKAIPVSELQKSTARTRTGTSLYREVEGRYEFMPVKIGGVQLINPIIRVTARKQIIETPLVETKGSVKEIIQEEDYIINIRGVIQRADRQWPEEEIKALKKLYKENKAQPIDCALTTLLMDGHDEYVVITNLSFPDKQGTEVAVYYEMECVQDVPFELVIEE